MTSSVKKGNIYEGEVKKYLERNGWIVEGQHRKVMFLGPGRMIMTGRDIFGCDLIAKKAGERTHWIQVGTVSNKTAKFRQVEKQPWNLNTEVVSVWLRHQGKKRYDVYRLAYTPDIESDKLFLVGPTVININEASNEKHATNKSGHTANDFCTKREAEGCACASPTATTATKEDCCGRATNKDTKDR